MRPYTIHQFSSFLQKDADYFLSPTRFCTLSSNYFISHGMSKTSGKLRRQCSQKKVVKQLTPISTIRTKWIWLNWNTIGRKHKKLFKFWYFCEWHSDEPYINCHSFNAFQFAHFLNGSRAKDEWIFDYSMVPHCRIGTAIY